MSKQKNYLQMKNSISVLALFMAITIIACGNTNNESNKANLGSELAAYQENSSAETHYKVKITTNMGVIVLKLYNETPAHRDNFIKLAEEGYFDGTMFHRVIRQFMIQGGDPASKDAPAGQPLGSGGPGYTIEAEITPALFHKKGALAAARMGDQVNPERRSSGSQFYIVQGKVYTPEEIAAMEQQMRKEFTPEQRIAYTTVGGTPHLDGAYTVFGEVTEGFDVVERISLVATNPANRPNEDIVMKVEVLK
jgi:cyclophilin family peptidyl-prolyl cis-trans isomerase